MKKLITVCCTAAVLLAACKKIHKQPETLPVTDDVTIQPKEKGSGNMLAARTITTDGWTTGLLPVTTNVAQHILPDEQLKPLGVTLSGSRMYVSNNPEIFTGNGWLMQNSRTDATRGGSSYALNGINNVYLFHINKATTAKYIHLMVSNPNTGNITYTAKGSYYNNVEKPLTGKATGQSYFVAKDWLSNTLRSNITTPVTVQPAKISEVFKLLLNANNMVDARFEINTSGPAYYYTVITSTGNLTDAVNASQGTFAAGTYVTESANSYGREAGVYNTSNVTASNVLNLPSANSHIGFCLNTTAKFKQVEEQTSAALMTMQGASTRSYGNYGNQYNVSFQLNNSNTTAKTVKLYFASNAVDATKANSTWNGPVKLNGSTIDIYTQLNNPRQLLATWTVPVGIFNMTLNFYVPGLITTNQQLIFESY